MHQRNSTYRQDFARERGGGGQGGEYRIEALCELRVLAAEAPVALGQPPNPGCS